MSAQNQSGQSKSYAVGLTVLSMAGRLVPHVPNVTPVVTPPAVAPPAVAPPIPSARLWQTVTLTVASTAGNIIEETWDCDNGQGAYDSNLPAGLFTSNTQTQNCGYRGPGKYWPVVTVTDSAGNVSSAHVLITIPAPALPAKVTR